jgi:hemoglobin
MHRDGRMSKSILVLGCGIGLAALIGGCSETGSMSGPSGATSMGAAGSAPKDGELQLPSDYKSWTKFLVNIDKEANKQVRDIYINPTGAKNQAGKDFANGTMMAMELYKAKENPDGTLQKTPEGRLVKGNLAKVFLMGKGEGWGGGQPDNLKNGAWVYSASSPDGKLLAEDFTKCRACHAPLAMKDFVHRYDEYFEKRGKM